MNQGVCRFGRRSMPWLLAGLLATGMFSGTSLAEAIPTKRITEGHIDSTCIGDVSDPVCAIETWIACYALESHELCALLGVEGKRFNPDAQPNIFEYRIIRVLPITHEQTTPWLRNKSWFVPGLIEARTVERWCTSDCNQLSKDSFVPFVYYLRPESGEWRLAAWTNDISVTCEYPEPDNPACDLFFWDRATPWVHYRTSYHKYD